MPRTRGPSERSPNVAITIPAAHAAEFRDYLTEDRDALAAELQRVGDRHAPAQRLRRELAEIDNLLDQVGPPKRRSNPQRDLTISGDRFVVGKTFESLLGEAVDNELDDILGTDAHPRDVAAAMEPLFERLNAWYRLLVASQRP